MSEGQGTGLEGIGSLRALRSHSIEINQHCEYAVQDLRCDTIFHHCRYLYINRRPRVSSFQKKGPHLFYAGPLFLDCASWLEIAAAGSDIKETLIFARALMYRPLAVIGINIGNGHCKQCDRCDYETEFLEYIFHGILHFILFSVHPEIGQLGRDQGVRKILPQA